MRYVQLTLLSIAERREDCKFLDIGCHDGRFSLEFGKKIGAKKTYGVDIDEKALTNAMKRGVICRKADVNKPLPFPDGFFDVVLCNQVAEHLVNPDNCFKEIHRVLKSQGVAYISVPNLCALHNRVLVLFGMQPTSIAPSKFIFGNPLRHGKSLISGIYGHKTAFSPSAYKEMLKFYGLKIKRYVGTGFYPLGAYTKISVFLSKLFPTFSAYQIVVATKQ